MAIQDILARKETLLKPNDMNDLEKAKEISTGVSIEKLSTTPIQCCKESALEMAQWKDEQFKYLLIEKTKLLSSSAAQDSVKRCTIEEIYRELFNEEMPNSNPYIK
jgi:hypothetical protein